LARSELICRVTESVPRQPRTVVMPPATISSTAISGARVAGPPSPPPPRIWTCGSMNPGRTLFPPASITVVSNPRQTTVSGPAIASIRPPATRMSRAPSAPGEKTDPPRMMMAMTASLSPGR